jgi:hypothetical protein
MSRAFGLRCLRAMMQHSQPMKRRSLFKLGLAGAAVLVLAGGGLALWQRGLTAEGKLTAAGRAVFDALARAILDGSLPTDAAARRAALDAHLLRVDAAIAAFPPAVRGELADLLGLLASAPGRLTFAGLAADWPEASVAELQAMLEGWRFSSLALRQQAYHALRELTNAAYYADPQAWAALGYPGPVAV